MEETKSPLEDQLMQSMLIQGALTAMPDLPKMYPKIISIVDMIDKGIDEYLAEDKMIVLSKKNGRTFAIVLDKKVPFTINNNFDIETDKGNEPMIKNFEKSEWKNKLMDSVPLQTLKERYEKLNPDEVADNPSGNMLENFMKAVPK